MDNLKPYQLSISLVVFNNKPSDLFPLLNSIVNLKIKFKLIVIDNSFEPKLKDFFASYDSNFLEYIFNNVNYGYGKGHNMGIKIGSSISNYHLVVNPDVAINEHCVEDCIEYLENNKNIGLIMPKVLYPDGEVQYLCKLIPTPFHLIFRRFLPKLLRMALKPKMDEYELKNKDYNLPMKLNNLSGCFMLMPHYVLKEIGAFDERFFMYLEDTDLSRRISKHYEAVYYPNASIIHNYEKGSYKNKTLLKHHLKSAILYFNKWGWFFDKERRTLNKLVLNQKQ